MKAQLGQRLRLSDEQRRRLAAKRKELGRKLLAEVATLVTRIRSSDGTVSSSRGNGRTLVVKRGVRPSCRKSRSWSCAWPSRARLGATTESKELWPISATLVVDEIGYLPVSQTGAVLFFQRMSRRYEHASTVCIVKTAPPTKSRTYAPLEFRAEDGENSAAMLDVVVFCVFPPSRSPVPEQADHGFLGSRSLNEALTCR